MSCGGIRDFSGARVGFVQVEFEAGFAQNAIIRIEMGVYVLQKLKKEKELNGNMPYQMYRMHKKYFIG